MRAVRMMEITVGISDQGAESIARVLLYLHQRYIKILGFSTSVQSDLTALHIVSDKPNLAMRALSSSGLSVSDVTILCCDFSKTRQVMGALEDAHIDVERTYPGTNGELFVKPEARMIGAARRALNADDELRPPA